MVDRFRLVMITFPLWIALCFVVAAPGCGGSGTSSGVALDSQRISESPVNAISAQPVRGAPTGKPGQKLWVFVFDEHVSDAGKGKPGPGIDCTDDNTQTAYLPLDYRVPAGGLTFNYRAGSAPSSVGETAAKAEIQKGMTAWKGASASLEFTLNDSGGAAGPAADGNDTVGWVGIVPKTVLAATWVWADNGVITDVDVFYNTKQPWSAIAACGSITNSFDVNNVGTHEFGHVVGLDHVSDALRMATMYPSAPKGEVRKITLSAGDTAGAAAIAP